MTAGSIAVPTIMPLRAPVVGKLKNVIDTCTPIELRTETPNAEIYFTVDGSKPDPFAALGADRSTIKYTKPFKLREGKKVVKAVALSRDGTRESHIVTKTFEVDKCDGRDKDNQENFNSSKRDKYDFIDELEKERKKEIIKKRGILKKIVDTNMLSYRSDGGSLSDNESSRYHKETNHLGKRFSTKTINFADFETNLNKSLSTQLKLGNEDYSRKQFVLPDSSMQALRLQRETDFLKCIYCFASRPNDPHAKYCTECGKPLPAIPQTKLIPPQTGHMGTCFYCKSMVPMNTSICVICENPISPQLQPQASIKLQGKITCNNCATANPANYSTCVVCDNKLNPSDKVQPVDLALMVPQYPVTNGKSATCNQCFRINRADSRFCDWCGAKPQQKQEPISCAKCGGHNNPYSRFCIVCGSLIAPTSNMNSTVAMMNTAQPAWLSQIDAKASQILSKQYSTIATQTYGLFYTSSKSLENKSEKEGKLLKQDKEFFEKKPVLTAVSAGRGYWRQQMDHICAHLKTFAQNNAEFRAFIGEPRLGKISTAKVDIDSSWCTVTATFPIRNNHTNDTFNSGAIIERAIKNNTSLLNNTDYEMMAAAVAGRDSSLSGESITDPEDSYRSDNRNKKIKKKKPVDHYDDKLSGEDRQLIKELSKTGRGRPKEVEYILREGANPNAITKEGLNMLHLAIRNKHFECIPILLDRNANINAKVPPKGNTVLHEAVLLGPEAESVIKILLEYGANPTWKNSKNETPFDLAIKENNTVAINILGSHVGDSMVASYLKSKTNDIKP